MTLIMTLPVLAIIIGLLIYGLTTHKTMGLIIFGCGLLVALWMVGAQHTIKF